jgi:hypothetical protein
MVVAELVVESLKNLHLEYPQPDGEARLQFDEMRALLGGDET